RNDKTDSALAQDLALAGQQRTPAPTFQDTAPTAATVRQVAPATPARAKPTVPASRPRPVTAQPSVEVPQNVALAAAPAPAPAAAPAPAPREFGSGTGFGLSSGQRVCTSSNRPGDKLVATVNESVSG